MRKVIIYFILSVLLAGCGGIQMLSGPSREDLYTERFLMQIGAIKEKYREGRDVEALKELLTMNEDGLMPTEQAMRRNFIGAIYFSKSQYEKAIVHFDTALGRAALDKELVARVQLNLASSYYKLGNMDKTFSNLMLIDVSRMVVGDKKKFYLLRYKVSKELGKDEDEVRSLVGYLSGIKNLQELKDDQYFNYLMGSYFKLDQHTRLRMLENIEGPALCVSYLAYLEVEKLYYSGKKEDAKDYLDWVSERSSEYPEIIALADNFFSKMGNYSKIDTGAIGVVVPLQDRRETYGRRALLGIDSALKERAGQYQLLIEDSIGSGSVGALKVKKLIEQHHVAAIIGGLFPDEAIKEYQEAKKHGTLFISLSEVHLPREEKDHLLIEIPGSVESQINSIFSDKMLNFLGKRAAIVYPKSNLGESYVSEFWRKANLHGVEITGVINYDPKQTQYGEEIQNLLGLEFKREREEELEILKNVHSLEKSRVRRVNNLMPQLDFDWVFVPAYPNDALQLLPTFKYYDAYPINIVGGPSWRSKKLLEESSELGRLYFVGDEVSSNEKVFAERFKARYGRNPRLIEVRSYDSLSIIKSILGDHSFASRDELDIYIRGQASFQALSGNWKQADGIWMKEMTPIRLKRRQFEKVFDDAGTVAETTTP